MADAIKKEWQKLPTGAKVAIALVGAFVGYKIVTKIISSISGGVKAAVVGGELNTLIKGGETLSYPLSAYSAMADKLEAAMVGTWYDPTWEADVKEVLGRLNHSADFLKLQNAFGVRDGQNLQQWIVGDFNSDERQELNSILTSKGIIYQF